MEGVLCESRFCGIWAINEIDSVLEIHASNPTRAYCPLICFGCICSKTRLYLSHLIQFFFTYITASGGHSRPKIMVPKDSTYMTSYLCLETMGLSCTVLMIQAIEHV